VEIPQGRGKKRRFRKSSKISERSCFVLTDAGAAWAYKCGVLKDKSEAIKPHWNTESGALFFAGLLTMKIHPRARDLRPILDKFQELGWRERIDNPLPGVHRKQRLHDAIKRLNLHLLSARIRFHGDDMGLRIRWNAVFAGQQ
jgi:hypothetical protein